MLAPLAALALAAAPFVDFEGGIALPARNDVAIPNAATRFSLTDDLSTSPVPYGRLRLGATFAGRHTVFLFAAPLRATATGTAPRDLDFAGERFPAGARLRAGYRFDSYRVTYRYALVSSERMEVALGATLKVRDAAIDLAGGGGTAEKTNLGLVPLASFRVSWWFAPRAGLLLDGDALAGGPGRAEDVLVALQWKIRGGIAARAGYRILEGGADARSVYNFALFHFLAAGLEVAL